MLVSAVLCTLIYSCLPESSFLKLILATGFLNLKSKEKKHSELLSFSTAE